MTNATRPLRWARAIATALLVYAAITVVLSAASALAHGHHHHDHNHDHHHDHDHGHHSHSEHQHTGAPGTLLSRVLATLFPTDSPAVGALLATAYISIFPNLVLFVVPATISRKTLNTLVSFAAGGLIGDVVLHLIPHALMDAASVILAPTPTEHEHDHGHDHEHHEHHHHHHGHEHGHAHSFGSEDAHARFHQGATVIGIAIFAGILVFFAVDKYMRIQGIGRKDSHGHSHSHSHSHQHHHHHGESVEQKKSAEKTDGDSKDGLRKRNVSKESTDASSVATAAASPAPKAVNYSIYLNMVADASHNFTDGLAIAASFYTSRSIGISTFIAVAFHEIPHEFGDFAILLRGGFPRWKAIATQGLTAIGAFMGTFVGILLEEIARGNSKDSVLGTFLPAPVASALNGLSKVVSIVPAPAWMSRIAWSQLVIPFTAGGFLYIATCGVIPDLLGDTSDDDTDDELHKKDGEITESKAAALRQAASRQFIREVLAMCLGVFFMAVIALNE